MTSAWPFDHCDIVEELSGGSNRRFFRVRCAKGVFVVMQAQVKEIERYIKVRDKLSISGIGVPSIVDVKDKFVLLEDLGDLSLYKYVKTYGPSVDIYKKVMSELIKLQKSNIDGLPVFGREKLFGEFLHFKRFYVPYVGIDVKSWDEKVYFLVEKCHNAAYVPMHRDLQSTNIFIKNGKIYFVDFQDMHMGPLYFDIASLLFDPYIMLKTDLIWQLVEYYKGIVKIEFEREGLLSCGVLRLMQALGAFVKLSMEGKVFFERFIKAGRLRLMELLRDMELSDMADLL